MVHTVCACVCVCVYNICVGWLGFQCLFYYCEKRWDRVVEYAFFVGDLVYVWWKSQNVWKISAWKKVPNLKHLNWIWLFCICGENLPQKKSQLLLWNNRSPCSTDLILKFRLNLIVLLRFFLVYSFVRSFGRAWLDFGRALRFESWLWPLIELCRCVSISLFYPGNTSVYLKLNWMTWETKLKMRKQH